MKKLITILVLFCGIGCKCQDSVLWIPITSNGFRLTVTEFCAEYSANIDSLQIIIDSLQKAATDWQRLSDFRLNRINDLTRKFMDTDQPGDAITKWGDGWYILNFDREHTKEDRDKLLSIAGVESKLLTDDRYQIWFRVGRLFDGRVVCDDVRKEFNR